MMPKTGVTGTLWKAVPAGGGYFHLTTLFMEKDGKVLEGNVGDASAGASDHFKGGPHMVTGRPTGTMWKFIPVQ